MPQYLISQLLIAIAWIKSWFRFILHQISFFAIFLLLLAIVASEVYSFHFEGNFPKFELHKITLNFTSKSKWGSSFWNWSYIETHWRCLHKPTQYGSPMPFHLIGVLSVQIAIEVTFQPQCLLITIICVQVYWCNSI